ncbi:F0F1 ATP synthase subunit delta [Desulfovibrio sp. OttesenSCG-928-C06]|nr:F0F1 ATP synthase subunit delta [Desulfovibrio sp. OttesenSCG-928-C06]
MTGNIVARRYARALFALGRKQGLPKLEKLGEDLLALKSAVESSDTLGELYKSPLFSAEEKIKVTRTLLADLKADDYTVKFCELLSEKGRLGCIGELVAIFKELLDAEKGVLHGELVTAVNIEESKRKAVLEQLEKQAGRSLELTYAVDPAIIGGIILKVGDRVMDASLKAQLSSLKENIKRGM